MSELKLYVWEGGDNTTIFVLADGILDAKRQLRKKSGDDPKVLAIINRDEPIIYGNIPDFILQEYE